MLYFIIYIVHFFILNYFKKQSSPILLIYFNFKSWLDKFFLEPPLYPKELFIFYKYLNQSKIFFEYGSGGTTHQALKRRLQIYSVEIHKSWIWQLEKEIKNIKTRLKSISKDLIYLFSFNITYIVVDLQSEINNKYSDYLKYIKLYNHSLYNADFIFLNGKFKFAILMHLFNEIDFKTKVFIHNFDQENHIPLIEKYFDIIDSAEKSYVFQKKNKGNNTLLIPPEILKKYEIENILNSSLNTKTLSYLHLNFKNIVDKFRYSNDSKMIKPIFNRIWLCWWQGEENAPDLVKICFKSIRKNFKYGNITIITKKNYFKYITIPTHIIDKYKSKNITLINFTDVLRVFLISRRGGIWIDATIFAIKKITTNIFNYSFYTAHSPNSFPISFGYWKMFIQGSHINCPVTMFVSDVFNEYLKKFDQFFSYFMIDYLYLFGYEFIPSIRRIIDAVPSNNWHVYRLYEHLNDIYSKPLYHFLTSEGMFMKLSLKSKITSVNNGNLTIYGHIKKKYLLSDEN